MKEQAMSFSKNHWYPNNFEFMNFFSDFLERDGNSFLNYFNLKLFFKNVDFRENFNIFRKVKFLNIL